jgi:glycosyltransferase involved in cell wall biosynthesis
MRITYLHQYFNTPDMPGGTRSYEMARRLVAMGHEVNMITSWREPDTRKTWFETDEAGIKVHWLPVPYSNKMSYAQRIRSFFRFAIGAARKAASLPTDVVFATSTPLTIALPGVYATHRQAVPMVFEVRDLWPELPIAIGAIQNPIWIQAARWLERFAYNHAEIIVALSPGMQIGIEKVGISSERITVIPNSCDLDSFSPNREQGLEFRRRFGIPEDRLLITYGGTFGRINGVSYLVRLAYALRSDNRFYFLLVGDGQERDDVERLAQQLGVLNSNLLMLPKVKKTIMFELLAATDIATSLFIPLREMEENSANKFFDGLASGCCMAINYGGWQAELLELAGAGLQLNVDPEKAANELVAFMSDPSRLAIARNNARRLAEEKFSRDQLALELEQVFSKAIALSTGDS